MLTQDMIDVIGHILRPFISRSWSYPPAVHILQLALSCSHSNPPYAYTFRALMACALQHASHSYHPLGNRRGPSGSPDFNMPTRQLISAHSAASNHSPAPPNNSRVDTPKVSTRDWLASPQTPRIFRHSAKDAPGNAHITQFSRTSLDNIHYSLQEDFQTFGIGNLSCDYSTIRSLSIFVTCGFI